MMSERGGGHEWWIGAAGEYERKATMSGRRIGVDGGCEQKAGISD